MFNLFSYGTLRYEQVQLATFGRTLAGQADHLLGYHLSMVKITDPKVIVLSGEDSHPMLIATGNLNDEVAGMVFEVTEAELLQADEYEVADYKRVLAPLKSGGEAWVYVQNKAES